MGKNAKTISLTELLQITAGLLSHIKVPIEQYEDVAAPIMMAVKNLNVGIEASAALEKKLQELSADEQPAEEYADDQNINIQPVEGPEEGDEVVELGAVDVPVEEP